MLIRRKSSTDDEYHHEDPLGVFGVITGANAAVLSSNVYDAFMGMQYVQGVSKTTQPAICYKALSEPSILTGSGGQGVVVPSRGFQVMGKKSSPAKKQPCKKPTRGPHDTAQCNGLYNACMKTGLGQGGVAIYGIITGAAGIACTAICLGTPLTAGALAPACALCLELLVGGDLGEVLICIIQIHRRDSNCAQHLQYCYQTGWWNY